MTKMRSSTTTITLRARHVLPMSGPPIENGWIRIVGQRMVAIGRGRPSGEVRDLGDSIVLPGLVNAHTHLEFSDLDQPLSAAGGLPAWIERVVTLRRGRNSDAAERGRGIMLGLQESAAAGVTAIGEIATAAPLQNPASGPLLRVFREMLGLSLPAMALARSVLVRELDHMEGGGVAAGVSPHAPFSVGQPLGSQIVGEAVRRRLPVAMHLAESRDEAELLATGGGAFRTLLEQLGAWQPHTPKRFMPVADWISLLARAARGIVVHGTFLPEKSSALSRLSRHRDRLCVVVCPRTTQALSGRLPPVKAFRDVGIRVAIGTDSRASNPDLSVVAECRTLVDGGLASPCEALAMATLHGAWALAFERRCGMLAPGRPADIAILRPVGPYRDPFAAAIDPATQVAATLRRGRVISGSL